jgi:hypothetical protein
MSSRCTDSTKACACGHLSYVVPYCPADSGPGRWPTVTSGRVVRDVQRQSPGPGAPAGLTQPARRSLRRSCSCSSQRDRSARAAGKKGYSGAGTLSSCNKYTVKEIIAIISYKPSIGPANLVQTFGSCYQSYKVTLVQKHLVHAAKLSRQLEMRWCRR